LYSARKNYKLLDENRKKKTVGFTGKPKEGQMKIIADLHTHTVASGHAYSTHMENIGVARKKRLQVLGTSEHAPAMDDAPKEIYFENLRVVNKEWGVLKVLHGVELNILNGYGDVDLKDESLNELDYAIASLHPPIFPTGRRSLCTEAAISVMSNPHVYIIGHPDDDHMPLDYEALTLAAKHNHVALEVNNSSLSPGSFRAGAANNYCRMLKLAKDQEVPVIVSSDSHICYDVGNFTRALALLDELEFPEELVVNSSSKRFADFWSHRKSVAQLESNNIYLYAV